MITETREITKERYEELMAMPREDAEFSYCGRAIICGYGLYEFKMFEENGKYFVTITRGKSCD